MGAKSIKEWARNNLAIWVMKLEILAEALKEWARNDATNILRVAIILLFLGLAIWATVLNHFGRVIANSEPWLLLTDALIDVAPELAGIVIGIVTIDYLAERRQREQLKEQLIRQMGMNIRDVAVLAARELAHHHWLYDGSLSRAQLGRADLRGANLGRADLRGANLGQADLRGTNLLKANLSGSNLYGADLSKADLRGADLSKADLSKADLSGAQLTEANLSGSNFEEANLSGLEASAWINLIRQKAWNIEQLEQAETLEGAVMPDRVQLGREKIVRKVRIRIEGIEGPTFEEEKFVLKEHIEGPTFEEWKEQYLAKQAVEKSENELNSELDDTADEQTESDSQESS